MNSEKPERPARIVDADYFSDLSPLTHQIKKHRTKFFTQPDGSLIKEFVDKSRFNAADIIVGTLDGDEQRLRYGVLTGLVVVLFAKPYLKTGLEIHLSRINPLDKDNLNNEFLKINMPEPNVDFVDDRFAVQMEPVLESIGEIYGFDGDCRQTEISRDSVLRGFAAGANAIINMCDDWETFIRDVRPLAREEQGLKN